MKKKKSIIFVQPMDPYRHEFLVCAGATLDEVVNKITDKNCAKWMQEGKHCFDEIAAGEKSGYTASHDKKGWIAVILPPVKDAWEYWESLLHELSHVVDIMVESKSLHGEGEARAYLHEFLFRQVRRRLQGVK